MTVLSCKLCRRFMYASVDPNINPVALANPKNHSFVFSEYANCNMRICGCHKDDRQQGSVCQVRYTLPWLVNSYT